SSADSTAGSSATSTAAGSAADSAATSPAVGSATCTISAPACCNAACSFSQAPPGRASSATRVASAIALLRRRHAARGQQFEHVAQQLVLLVGLAEVALHAELQRALAVLLAGARGDHDDRQDRKSTRLN